METADVVIVGAGVMGTSIAYHLAQRGCTNVVVLEREHVAAGTTGRSVGGVRYQYASETNIRLSQISIPFFERFAEEMGIDPYFHQCGYLFLTADPEVAKEFREHAALQRSLGVEVFVLTPAEVLDLVPQMNVEDLVLGTFGPRDGYADPSAAAQGFAEQGRRLGVRYRLGTTVTGIGTSAGRVAQVHTSRGDISTPVVVNAAGPWSAEVGRMVGVDVPVQPRRRHVFVTAPFDLLPARLPFVIDFDTAFYFRPEGPGILMSQNNDDEPYGFNPAVDWNLLPRVIEHALHRCPVLEQARVMTAWSGHYEVTPDNQPVLGAVPEMDGFICATGFSGHGFMHSPAVGLLTAELILDGRITTVDVSALGIQRFREGRLAPESRVI